MSRIQIPVFIFTGFLDSGKTVFIKNILADERFNNGIKTLLIVCEEGEEEYDFSEFASDSVVRFDIESEKELTTENLESARKRADAKRILIEYNGMWMLDTLFSAFPRNWGVAQELTFADAKSYASYNANMRSLVVDKLKSCDTITFNRIDNESEKQPLHDIVRSVGRGTEILYDFGGGRLEIDDIVDPLPFDVEADEIEIGDRDYALWYADTMENLMRYDGKTVKFKAFFGNDQQMPKGTFLAGRHIMTCCANDARFAGMVCIWNEADKVKTGMWGIVTAKISVESNKIYRSKGPVLYIKDIEFCKAPPQDEQMVMFT